MAPPTESSTLTTLLLLPRELRDLIYHFYLCVDGGYVHDFAANKLRQASDQPIELSLRLTCRQIASETHGLALQLNTLRFTTFHSDDTREHAGLLHAVNEGLQQRKVSLLNCLAHDLLDQEHARRAKTLYPQFTPVVDHWQAHGGIDFGSTLSPDFGEVASTWRDFVAFTLDLVSQQPEFLGGANTERRFEHLYESDEASVLNKARPEPWKILDAAETARLQQITQTPCRRPFVWPSPKYTYSAASTALRFLHSITKSTRDNIRKILLFEDRESIAFPESHGRGFITICQDHRKLQVERYLDLWRNGFPVSTDNVSSYLEGDQSWIDDGLVDHHRCVAKFITKALGAWLMEATVLPSLGMPSGSFTLVLDGASLPEHTSRVFGVIQRDVAWQTALNICYARGLLPRPSWFDQRLHTTGFMFEGLPEAVGALSMDSPLIRTNFQLSSPCDVEQLLQERVGWSAQDWEEGWATHEPHEFQTEAPLPPWHLLRWQHVIR